MYYIMKNKSHDEIKSSHRIVNKRFSTNLARAFHSIIKHAQVFQNIKLQLNNLVRIFPRLYISAFAKGNSFAQGNPFSAQARTLKYGPRTQVMILKIPIRNFLIRYRWEIIKQKAASPNINNGVERTRGSFNSSEINVLIGRSRKSQRWRVTGWENSRSALAVSRG